jgi:peptidoglycan/xylan/chitin deacetylase (PgdA/CDA1 family)
VIAFTFDAGANNAALASILATLRSKSVPATFFLTGNWVLNFPGDTRTIAGRGYMIGNHTQTHPDLRTLSESGARNEINRFETTLKGAINRGPDEVFRFPFGSTSADLVRIVNSEGYVAVRWTVDTLGWKGTSGGQSVETVTTRVITAAKPGAIVLMHVGSHPQDRSTLDADALPGLIDSLRAKGYTFVDLGAFTP